MKVTICPPCTTKRGRLIGPEESGPDKRAASWKASKVPRRPHVHRTPVGRIPGMWETRVSVVAEHARMHKAK